MQTGVKRAIALGLAVGAGVFAGCAPATAATRTQTLTARFEGAPAVAAFGGRVLWSRRDRTTGLWTLMQWHAGTVRRVAVRARATPFDVDAGPGADGQPTAVYSRCAVEPISPGGFALGPDWSRARGCHVYEADLASGRERVVRALVAPRRSDTTPAIWRDTIVFARRIGTARRPELLAWRRGRLHKLPSGSVGASGDPGATIEAIDLGPRTVAFAWRYDADRRQVWALRLDAELRPVGARVLAEASSSGECGYTRIGRPSVVGARVFYLRAASPCEQHETGLFAAATGESRQVAAGAPGTALTFVRSGTTAYWVRDTLHGPSGGASADDCTRGPQVCSLMATTGLRYAPSIAIPDIPAP